MIFLSAIPERVEESDDPDGPLTAKVATDGDTWIRVGVHWMSIRVTPRAKP